ncbi:MAG: menaquinone biosynthetic enzyme MqnA/MqnD family protein [Terriglobales bacterium]
MRRLRISAISYLNTAPLMWDFRQGAPGFAISYTVPSQCAAELAEGRADIGIIPAAAYAGIPGLMIIPGIAIASRRAVRSILLVSKVPLEAIQSVALDSSSLTSVALIRILFAKWWGGKIRFAASNPDLPKMLERHDAALVIGDTALKVDRSRYITYDLAEEWIRFTGKAFVFAFWAIRQAALDGLSTQYSLTSMFQRSRDSGLKPESLNAIAHEWAARLDLSEFDVKSYLTENIHYDLDPECLDGLQLFYRYAAECRALAVAPPLRFLESEKLAAI